MYWFACLRKGKSEKGAEKMNTLKNKQRELFYSWRDNLASGPSEDEGTDCRKYYGFEKKPCTEQRNLDC